MSDENNEVVRESLSSIASAGTDPTDAYLSTFPPGYRFAPTDEEIIVHYLATKVENKVLPINKINEVNLYDHTPEYLTSEIFKSYEDEWYYYTSRDRKYPNGQRPNRSAGDGYWKATGVDKKIKTDDETEIGKKKTLVFYRGKAPDGKKTDWIMHEFRVEQSQFERNSRADMLLDNYVLCRIYNKGATKSKTRRVQSEGEAAAAETSQAHAQEETTTSITDPMEYSNEEEVEAEGALNMITYEPAAIEVGQMSWVDMDVFAGSTFDDPVPIMTPYTPPYTPQQTYHPAPLNVQINDNYMFATPDDASFSTYGSSSHMQWDTCYDILGFSQDNIQLDYNDMMSSLSVNLQVPPPPPPPLQCGNYDQQVPPPPPLQCGNYDGREQVFRENDNFFPAGWSGSTTTTANVIPNYCQDYTHDYVLPRKRW